MTRPFDGPTRGSVFELPPALLLWMPIIGTLAILLAVWV